MGDATYPNLEVVDALEQENPKTGDQGTDRPGRAFASVGRRRAAPRRKPIGTSWRNTALPKGNRDTLYSAAHRGQYSKLVIAAPPMIMGDLRKAFHKEVSAEVVAEVSKDLTNMPAHEIERILAGNANSGA